MTEATSSSGPAVADNEKWDWVGTIDEKLARARAQERTKTGLLLMIIAFALLWIPYVSDLGALIALVGIGFLWLGRHGFGPAHRRNVLLGGACVALGLLIGIVIAAWFVDSLLTQTSPGQSTSSLVAVFQSDLGVLFVAGLATASLTAIAYLVLPYALADPTSRIVLFSAAVLTVVISALSVAIEFPQISTAVAQATSGSSISTGPITALQGESILLSTAQILPDLMFLWAYNRTRTRAFSDPSSFGRPTTPSGGPK